MPANIDAPSAPAANTPAAPTLTINFNGPVMIIGGTNTASGDMTIQVGNSRESVEPQNTSGRWRKIGTFLVQVAPVVGQFLLETVIKPFLGWLGFNC